MHILRATRLIAVVGGILAGVILCQTAVSTFFMTRDIRARAGAQLDAAGRTALAAFEDNLRQTAEDMKTLLAHEALGAFFTARVFGMTEEAAARMATFESFLAKVYRAKPQYTRIQLTLPDGSPVLQMQHGARRERPSPLAVHIDPAAWQRLIASSQGSAEAEPWHLALFDAQDGWAVLTVSPVRYQDWSEGVLLVYQPLQDLIRQILAKLERSGIACAVFAEDGRLIARSPGMAEASPAPGWLRTDQTFRPLGWRIQVGMPYEILFAQQARFRSISLAALAVSFAAAAAALWGLHAYQHGLERRIRDREHELLDKNLLLQDTLRRLEEARDDLQKEKDLAESDRRKVQSALDEIFALIQRVAAEKNFGVRFAHPALKRCWEAMQCENPACPCYGQEPMRCWQQVGSYNQEGAQGFCPAQAGTHCQGCPFFRDVTSDPIFQIGEQFNNMMHILEGQNKELQSAYADLKASQLQMLQQEKMATVGQLAAGVAHEINNPLGYVISNLASLRKYCQRILEVAAAQAAIIEAGGADDTGRQALAALKRQVKYEAITADVGDLIAESLEGAARVQEIVQNLKDYSRVDQAERQPANLNLLLDSSIRMAGSQLQPKVKVVTDYGTLPETLCHPQQLSQVFLNLLVNAGQAIDAQGEIRIRTRASGDRIFITVQDTGQGIPEEHLSRVFEPFFTTREIGKGIGLGLSVAHEIIVKSHQGAITVASEKGQGTTFTLQVPVVAP
ncbi:MAG: ATP-binding protein [Thermodesulfobacteriota bacterium]